MYKPFLKLRRQYEFSDGEQPRWGELLGFGGKMQPGEDKQLRKNRHGAENHGGLIDGNLTPFTTRS
jgi:hypothetical protein